MIASRAPTPLVTRPKVRLLGVDLDAVALDEFLDRFQSGFVVTPNADHFILLEQDEAFREAYRGADYILCDSQIVFAVLRLLGRPVPEKVSGSDLLPAFCRFHADNPRIRVGLLGGRAGVAAAAMARINARLGRPLIAAAWSPSMNIAHDEGETGQLIESINRSGVNVLAIGLGSPKQEVWIHRHRARFTHVERLLAVGAAIDFEAGTARRAPAWVSRCGLEWAYRLAREPRRLWRRYLVRDPRFLWLALRDAFKPKASL